MRFFSFLLVAAMISTNVVCAQTREEMQASQERYAKLVKLCENEPKETEVPEVDTYISAVYTSAIAAVATTEQLQDLYYRQIGETKDGVTDVTIKKPTVEELVLLSETIGLQAIAITAAASSAENAVKASKGQKNLKVARAAAAGLIFTKDAYPILLEESAFQTKAIAEMIETAKSSQNL